MGQLLRSVNKLSAASNRGAKPVHNQGVWMLSLDAVKPGCLDAVWMLGRRLCHRCVFAAIVAERFHDFVELVRIDGFGDVVVHACLQTLLLEAGHGVGGHGHDGCVAVRVAFQFTDPPSRFQAIQFGHLDIHQHEIEGPLPYSIHGFSSVVNYLHGVSHELKQPDGNLLVHQAIFREQDRLGTVDRRWFTAGWFV